MAHAILGIPRLAPSLITEAMAQTAFTPEQVQRYARHLILPEVGGAGQRKLMNTSVLLLGAGGLGSPAAMYLAAAGIGKIGIVDFDAVDASNLQRQILHGVEDLGRPKVDSAADTLSNLNPDVEVGRLLIFEGMDMTFRTVNLRRNPDCPLCGDHPTVTSLIDYEQFCGVPAVEV